MRPLKLALRSLAAALLLGAAAAAEQPPKGLGAPRWVARRFVAERTAVGLAWTAVPGAARYLVLRAAEGEGEARQIAATPGLQLLDSSVVRGVRYRYTVRADGPGGSGPPSVEAEVYALEAELIPPEAPRWTDLVEGEGGKAQLLWAPVRGAIAYSVHRRPAGAAGAADAEFQLLASVGQARFTDSDVRPGERYEYRVGAVSQTLVEGALSEVRALTLGRRAEPSATRDKGPSIRLRPSREALVLRGEAGRPIKAPVDLEASADGEILVLDNQLPGVLVFEPGGTLQRVIGGPDARGEERLRRPYGIAVDAQGTIWVTDHRERSVIVAFDPASGRTLKTVPFEVPPRPEALERLPLRLRGERPFALDVAFLPGGEMVVTDNTFARVCVLGPGGALIREFGLPGDKPGEFNRPSKITVDPEGRVFVLDAQNKRAQAFDGEGRFLFEIGRSPTMVGSFIGLSGIAWDDEGALLVADSPMATVQAFDRASGAYRYHLGREDGAMDPGGTRPLWDVITPVGLAIEPKSGRLWIGMPMAHALTVRELLPASAEAPR
ncbi:MAG: NHL repeat-containing protein [Acidobacteria bacterium]|nr:NHL repeat-containing protein [Acidobacteriota bacterium]